MQWESSIWSKRRKIKVSELGVTVEVCRRRVILLCIREKVMDTSVAAEGGPLRNHPQSAAHFIYTRRCCIFPPNLITDTLFFPFSIHLFIFLISGEYTRNAFPKRKSSNRDRQVYCIGCWPSHFCTKSNEISQMTQAVQICKTISYARESTSLFYKTYHVFGLRCWSFRSSSMKWNRPFSLGIHAQKGSILVLWNVAFLICCDITSSPLSFRPCWLEFAQKQQEGRKDKCQRFAPIKTEAN